jgi:hypothetical protein
MKFLSVLFSAISLVAFAQAAAVVAERDMATQHVGVCPAGTAQVGKTKGYHDELVQDHGSQGRGTRLTVTIAIAVSMMNAAANPARRSVAIVVRNWACNQRLVRV